MQHKQITSARGTTHYWINRKASGNHRCLVFTHGLTANHTMFEKQVAHFSKDHVVLTWDVPLHGLSRPYTDFSYHNTAKELNAVLEAEDIQEVVLVGMSMGGYPSQEFAARYPEKVLGFVALDTTPFGLAYYSKSDVWWLKQVEALARWIPNGMLRRSMARSVSRTDYSYELMLTMLEPLSKADIVEQMGIAYGKFIEENRDVHFDFPVLILVGEYDNTGKVRDYCEAWAQEEGYPLRVIKNAAHLANCDNPTQVNAEIERFVSSLG